MLTCLISNVSVNVQSIQRPDRIDEHTTLTITIRDDAGTALYEKGNPISVTDSILGNLFTGYVSQPHMENLYPNVTNLWTLACLQEGDYLAAKRTSNWAYANQQAGVIAVHQIQEFGSAEGLVVHAALRWDEKQTDWASGTLTNCAATTNATNGNPGGGDLELALAGSKVSTTGSGAGFGLTNGLKFTGYCSSGYSSAYVYRQIWSGSQVITSSTDYIGVDVWGSSDSPEIKFSVEAICSDGTTLSSTAQPDQQGMSAAPATDLSGLANDQWYSRIIGLPSSMNGKTIVSILVAIGGTRAGTYTCYFRNIGYYTFGGGLQFWIFGPSTTLSTNIQAANIGYSNVSLTQVSVEDKSNVSVRGPFSIDAAKIVKDSSITFTSLIPSGCTGIAETSIDNQASWQQVTSGSAIPNLLAGMSIASRNVYVRFTFSIAKDPTVNMGFGAPTIVVDSAYNATKSDSITTYTTATDFNTDTLTDLKTVGSTTTPAITTNGIQRNWDDANYSSQTVYGTSGPTQIITNKQLILETGTGTDVRSRLDFVGQWADFTAEVDVTAQNTGANAQSGLVYRTTGWQNNNDTYAYMVGLSTTELQLGRGTNSSSGGGSFTAIGSPVTVSLTASSVHRLKVVASGSSHKIYLDGVLLINATDSTYTAAGYIGLRLFNNSGSTVSAAFDNFGVCSALSGTWESPSIDISGPGTYGNSVIEWDVDGLPDSTTTITAQTSIDGGSTWQSATNGGAISGLTAGGSLSGKHLLIKMTLTASNAPVVPVLNGVTVWVIGQYSASGTRVSPSLSLAGVGRAGTTLVNWNALTPTGTSLAVQTSINGGSTYQTVSSPGNAISGISTQPTPTEDTFTSNTSGSYTQSNWGGTTGTWAWDTADSRLSGSGGNFGTIVDSTALASADNQVIADFDECDGSGILTNYTATTSGYYIQIWDSAASSGTPNTVKLFRRSGGTSTQVSATATISFLRGSIRRFVLDVEAGVITAKMDGDTIITYTDGSPLGAGSSGLVLNTLSRVYLLRIQQYGQDVTSLSVLVKHILSTTDPTATVQVLDNQVFVSSPDIGPGNTISSVKYQGTFISDDLNDLKTRSNYYSYFSGLYLIFQLVQASPAPFVLADVNTSLIAGQQIGDILLDGIGMDNGGDLFRNCIQMKNVDDGMGGTTIVTRNNTSFSGTITQSMMAAIENAAGGSSSGIIEAVYDATGLSIAEAQQLGDQLLQEYGKMGRTFTPKTLRSGLTPGMQLSVFSSAYNLHNVQFLITQIDVVLSIAPGVSGGLLYAYKLSVTEAANLGTWVVLFKNLVV